MTRTISRERGGTNGHLHAVLDSLSPADAMLAVECEFPGWHLYLSDTHMVWAVTCHCPWGGCGVTLEAPNAEEMWRAIAAEEHHWAVHAA